jgi:hypothetical protein
LKHRIELTKQHSTRAQHHDQHRPESLGQKHQARDVDGKSLTELLGRNARLGEAERVFTADQIRSRWHRLPSRLQAKPRS